MKTQFPQNEWTQLASRLKLALAILALHPSGFKKRLDTIVVQSRSIGPGAQRSEESFTTPEVMGSLLTTGMRDFAQMILPFVPQSDQMRITEV